MKMKDGITLPLCSISIDLIAFWLFKNVLTEPSLKLMFYLTLYPKLLCDDQDKTKTKRNEANKWKESTQGNKKKYRIAAWYPNNDMLDEMPTGPFNFIIWHGMHCFSALLFILQGTERNRGPLS